LTASQDKLASRVKFKDRTACRLRSASAARWLYELLLQSAERLNNLKLLTLFGPWGDEGAEIWEKKCVEKCALSRGRE